MNLPTSGSWYLYIAFNAPHAPLHALPEDYAKYQSRYDEGWEPVFDGDSLGDRPPIHLLFSSDRGLRDGDWKAVSFRQETWELYNMAEDRAELNDLA